MMADLRGIEAACHGMGVQEAFPLFASLLTARPYDEMIERSKTRIFSAPYSKTESKADRAVIRGYAKKYFKDIMVLLGNLPPQMLLLLKMNDCLRHIDYALGSPTNTLIIAGKYASRAVYEHRKKDASFLSRIFTWLDYVHVVVRIHLYDLGVWVQRVGSNSHSLSDL